MACSALVLAAPSASAAPTATPVAGLSQAGEAITRAADGTMWIAEPSAPGAVAHVTPGDVVVELTGGITSNFPAGRNPSGMAAMPDGSVWFLLSGGSEEFGRISSSGVVGRYSLVVGRPTSLLAGPDGYLWVTAEGDNPGDSDAIVRIDTSNNSAVDYATGLDEHTDPRSITLGPDGALWFVEGGGSGRVGRITTTGVLSWQAVGGAPSVLSAGALGAMWFNRDNDLGRLGGGGVALFDAGRPTTALAAGPDGAMWAAATGGVVRTDADGTVTFHTMGLNSAARGNGIAAGADGRMWMTLDRAPYLVRITVPPLLRSAAATADSATTASITADVSPNGLATDARVEVRPAGGSWSAAGQTAAGSGTTALPVSFALSGLAAGTAHDLRVVATNAAGTVTGATVRVTTASAPVLTTPTTTLTTPAPTVTTPAPTVSTIAPTVTTPAPALTTPTPTLKAPTVAVAAPVATEAPPVETATPTTTAPPTATAEAPAATTTTPRAAAGEPAPEPADPAPAATAVPSQGRSVVLAPVTGSVRYRVPGKTDYLPVDGNATVPVGAVVDATNGTVVLASQVGGATQEGRFHGGVFRVRQPADGTGVTQLQLAGGLACGKTAAPRRAGLRTATATKRKAPIRRLWGEDRGGRFQTHGHDSVATVRGTSWLTQDTCAGTLVRVYQGTVEVRPSGKPKATPRLVRAGQSRFTARHR